MNSLLELHLLVACSKSERIGSSIDYERNAHSITKSSDRFDILDLSLNRKELLRCMGEIFDVYPNSSRSQNCLDRSYYFFGGLTESRDNVHREWDREWDREDLSDSFDSRHKFITTNSLAIRVA